MQLTNATITMVSRLKYIRKYCFICKDKTIIWKFKRKRGQFTSSTLSQVSANTYAPYPCKRPRLAT